MLATLSSVRVVLVPVPIAWLAVITSAVPSPFNLIPGIGRKVAATSPVMGGEADAHGLLDDMEVVFWQVEFFGHLLAYLEHGWCRVPPAQAVPIPGGRAAFACGSPSQTRTSCSPDASGAATQNVGWLPRRC